MVKGQVGMPTAGCRPLLTMCDRGGRARQSVAGWSTCEYHGAACCREGNDCLQQEWDREGGAAVISDYTVSQGMATHSVLPMSGLPRSLQ